jgi:hypothetical protein
MKSKQLQPLLAVLLALSFLFNSCTGSDSGPESSSGPGTTSTPGSTQGYMAFGSSGMDTWSGKICSFSRPFTIELQTDRGNITFKFYPGGDPMKGTWTYHNEQSSNGVIEDGLGSYSVTLAWEHEEIKLTGQTTLQIPNHATELITVHSTILLKPEDMKECWY